MVETIFMLMILKVWLLKEKCQMCCADVGAKALDHSHDEGLEEIE